MGLNEIVDLVVLGAIFKVILIIGLWALGIFLFVAIVTALGEIKPKNLLQTQYKGKTITVKRSLARTELLIDSEVKATKYGLFEFAHSLRTQLDDEYIIYQIKPKFIYGEMYLYADSKILEYKARFF